MKTTILLGVLSCMLLCTSIANGWQGRMESMQNPVGIVDDESDFLTHPALLRDFEDMVVFGGFQFAMEQISDFGLDVVDRHVTGLLVNKDFTMDGHADTLGTTVGIVLPYESGTFGFVFSFDHEWGKMEGDVFGSRLDYNIYTETFSIASDYLFRFMYAMDATEAMSLGAELSIAYRTDTVDTVARDVDNGVVDYTDAWKNDLLNGVFAPRPRDMSYWELNGALSAEGETEELAYALTLHGGFIFGGTDHFDTIWYPDYVEYENNVNGWNIGGDVWLGYVVSDALLIPLVFSVNYDSLSSTPAVTNVVQYGFPDASETQYDIRTFSISVASGLQYAPSEALLLGFSLEYAYLDSFARDESFVESWYDNLADCETREHRFTGKLFAEYQLMETVSMAAGLQGWIGSVTMTGYGESYVDVPRPDFIENTFLMGIHYGLSGSLGLSATVGDLVFEPYVAAGFESYSLSGDRDFDTMGAWINSSNDLGYDLHIWFVTTGITIAFDGF